MNEDKQTLMALRDAAHTLSQYCYSKPHCGGCCLGDFCELYFGCGDMLSDLMLDVERKINEIILEGDTND